MFCPKCALENGDETKFCRGCGANLGGVLATVDGKPSANRAVTTFDDAGKPLRSLDERAIILQSRAIRGAITTVALLLGSGLLLFVAPPTGILWIVLFVVGLVVLAGTIARATHSSGYKKLAAQQRAELAGTRQEFLRPPRSLYDTDDLTPPFSVTERTTNLLSKFDDDEDAAG